jgi:hypothetical protein
VCCRFDFLTRAIQPLNLQTSTSVFGEPTSPQSINKLSPTTNHRLH